MKRIRFFFAFLLLTFFQTNGFASSFDVYVLESKNQNTTLNEIINCNKFIKCIDKSKLNFGVVYTDYWIKIVANSLDNNHLYEIDIPTITPDSIEIFEKITHHSYKHQYIGEGFFSENRFFGYKFKPIERGAIFYLKINGNGQPIALPLTIIDKNTQKAESFSLFVIGLLYGILALILILYVILSLNAFEKVYFYMLCYTFFATIVMLYFDGLIKYIFVPNSLYWNNQSIAIGMTCSFVMTNLYISAFLNIKTHYPKLFPIYKVCNWILCTILILSFWHPFGFKCYVVLILIMLPIEVILLFGSVIMVRKIEKKYFLFQLASVLFLIIFGTIIYLYFVGILPINFITLNSVYAMVLPQIFIQTFVLGKRLAIIIEEKSMLQVSLLKLSEQYSQSLILTIENERKRLSSEFHDSIGQNILVIRNQILQLLKKEKMPVSQTEKLHNLAKLTSETLDEVRMIAQDLRPTILDTLGISTAILLLVEKIRKSTPIHIDLVFDQNIDNLLNKEKEINFYRILQELFNNLLKHSQATNAKLMIENANLRLNIFFQDDGIGFDIKNGLVFGTGNGLSSIKERVNILNGSLEIDSKINRGTTIQINFPTI